MRRTSFLLFGVPQRVGFAVVAMLVVALLWATAAQAQTPADDQYGGPNAVAGSYKAASGGGGSAGSGSGGAQVGGSKAKLAGASGSSKAGGVGGSSGRLPATGGLPLPVIAGALVVAASGAGLMLLRSGRDR